MARKYKLPHGVSPDFDRHGNMRLYFRAYKKPKIRLYETPGTDEFEQEVAHARLGIPYGKSETQPAAAIEQQSKEGSLRWLVDEYERRKRPEISADLMDRRYRMLIEICDSQKEGKPKRGTLPYAYLVRGPMPLVVGVVLTGIWALWFPLRHVDGEGVGVVIAATGTAFIAIAALHRRSPWQPGGVPWRDIGVFGLLIGLFAACIPGAGILEWRPLTLGWLIGSVVLGVAAAVIGSKEDRWTLLLAAGGLLGALLFTFWPVIGGFGAPGGRGNAFVTSALAVIVYLAVATGAAMLGALLDSQRITVLAGLMLALFTTLQAFAVFAPILSGSVLFLTLGVVLIAIGWLADRGRRRLFPRRRTTSGPTLPPTAAASPEGQ